MADTSDTDGLEITVSSHDTALNTDAVLGGSRDGDRDQDNDSGNNNDNSNNNISLNLSVTATPQARRIIMDGDGDGAPSSSTDSSPRHIADEKLADHGDGEESLKLGVKSNTTIKFDDSSAESTPRRSKSAHQDRSAMKSPGSGTNTPGRGGPDLSTLDMKASWGESSTGGGSAKAGMLADPAKIAREREKEERVRQARERLMEERRKKLEELREQQRIAQENRERQLEMRRQKIEDLRRRDSERRAAVEERRRVKEETERARRESILQKAEERVARYEAWKAGGRKGGRGHVLGFGSATPRDICQRLERPRRSSSQSALGPRSPNGSDMGSVRPQRRALSACSAVRRHCCVDMNRMGMFGGGIGIVGGGGTPRHLSMSTSVLYHKRKPEFSSMNALSRANRPESTMGPSPYVAAWTPVAPHHHNTSSTMTASMPSPVRLRDRAGGGSRKQRPNSVATSMPSFLGGEPARSPRSKSTDRGGRDRSKARSSSRREKSKESLDKSKDGDQEEGKDATTKEKKTPSRVSLSFFDRLATPKFSKKDPVDQSPRDTPPKKDTPILRVKFADDGNVTARAKPQLSPRKAYSTSNLSTIKKKSSLGPSKPTPPSGKDSTTPVRRAPSRDSPRTRQSMGPSTPHAPSARAVSPAANKRSSIAPPEVKSGSSSPRVTPPPSSSPALSSSPSHQPAPAVDVLTVAASEDGTTPSASSPAPRPAPSSTQDITAEEYKARLAEKRRQAREKAEKEAEEERKRQEEQRLLEEEKQREQEEEERRQEEEALRLAEEARKAEQERLERAIEAEEKRKKEEAERMEAERIAKEEAEKKAKEEAERLYREQQERARREEEERLQRKKKLEMIMKRVKPDAGGSSSAESSPLKTTSGTPTLSQTNSSQVSPTDGDEKSVVESGKPASSPEEEPVGTPHEGQAIEPISDAMMSSFYIQEGDDSPLAMSTSGVVRSASSGDILDSPNEEGPREGNTLSSTQLNSSSSSLTSTPTKAEPDGESSKPKFKSPLLQQLVENKGGNGNDSSTPKFKSPLLQNLLGKTRVGARMGLSASMGDLSPNKEVAGGNGQSVSMSGGESETPGSNSLMTTSMTGEISGISSSSSNKELERQEQGEEDKDEDTSLHHKHSVSNGVRSDGEDNGDGLQHSKEDGSATTPSNGVLMADSALGSSIGFTMGQSSQSVISNGHHKALNLAMDDSSISLHSVDESVGPTTVQPPSTVFEAEEGGDHQGPGGPQGDGQSQFEELIDLLDTSSSTASASSKVAAPIIAFEETRRPDVTGQQRKQKDVPDIYPEPDSIHAPSQPLDLAISGSHVGEDKSGVRLQPLHGLENEDSQSVDTVSSTIQDRHPGNGTQVSIRSSEPVSTSPTLDSNYVITAPCSTSAPRNGDTGTDSAAAAAAAEMADVVEDTMRKPAVNTHRRPGVILLGRGNSFSLGRSEVIFLHNTKPYRRARGQKIQHQGSGGIVNNQDHPADPALHNSTPDNSPMSFKAGNSGISSSHDPATGTSSADHGEPSPPPLSNQVSHHSGNVSVDAAHRDANWPITFRSGKTTEENSVECLFGANYSKSTTSVCEERGSDNSDDLAALWARAELIMAGKQRAVLDVLEQFGVGESGEDTQQEEEEEESVWQVVENKTHAVDR